MQTTPRIAPMLLVAMLIGCDENRRLAEQAERNTEIQAQQNSEMARVNREVAAGTKQLVAADADARREMLILQQDLQAERQQIAAGQAALETERQRLAKQRQRDPIIAAAITCLGLALVCLLPLVLAGYLLHLLFVRGPEETIGDVLLMDLASDSPRLSPHVRVEPQAALPAPGPELPPDDDPPPF
jgi:hypothetical protein